LRPFQREREKEIAKAKVTQPVFPAPHFDNCPTEFTNDVLDFNNLSIKEGLAKAYVEFHEFLLTSTQVAKESRRKTSKILARVQSVLATSV
jgi:hypothetical protein